SAGGHEPPEPLRPAGAARGRTFRGHRGLPVPGLRRLRQLPRALGNPPGHALTARGTGRRPATRSAARAARVTARRWRDAYAVSIEVMQLVTSCAWAVRVCAVSASTFGFAA